MKMTDYLKEIGLIILTFIVSVITPIQHILLLLLFASTVNIIFGIRADKVDKNRPFSMKKAMQSFEQLILYFLIVIMIFVTFKYLGDENIGELAMKWLTYILIYFYSINILRNAEILHPKNKAIPFLKLVLTTEVFYRINGILGLFKKNKKDDDKE